MKTKFDPSELKDLDFKAYRARLYKELARMKAEHPDPSNPTQFLLISEFEFSDMKGKKIPMLIVGKREGEWKKYFKTEVKTRKNRDYAIGQCSFGQGGAFNLEVNAGKINGTWENNLNKALLTPAKLSASIVEKLVAEEELEADGAEDTAAETAAPAAPAAETSKEAAQDKAPKGKKKATKEQAIAAIKEPTKEEVTALSGLFGKFKTEYAVVQKEILPKIKSKTVGRQDWLAAKDLIALCEEIKTAFDKSNKVTQKAYTKGFGEVQTAQKELTKLAALVKEQKKSLAQNLADKFFQKQAKRDANPKEVALMQQNLKAVIAAADLAKVLPATKELILKAIYLTASLRGPAFKMAEVQKVQAQLGKKG